MILVLSLLVTNHEQRRQKKREVCWQCKGYPRWREMLFEDDSSGDAQEEQSNEVNGFVTKKRHSQVALKAFQPTRRRKTEAEISSLNDQINTFVTLSGGQGEGRTWTNPRPRSWKGMLFEDDSYIRRPRTTRPWGRSQRRERRNASETNEKKWWTLIKQKNEVRTNKLLTVLACPEKSQQLERGKCMPFLRSEP